MRVIPSTGTLAAFILAAPLAHATLITFDELPWHPIDSFSDYPVDTQYAAQGVTFSSAYLAQSYTPDPQPPHPNQYLLGAIDFTVTFSGTLPQYVSFNMSSPYGESSESYVTAIGPGSTIVGTGRTGGYYPDGTQEPPYRQDLPYQDNRYISFYSATGIRGLSFGDAYGSRLASSIDNLYFGAVPAVPEPASLMLGAAGLGVLAWARRRRKG